MADVSKTQKLASARKKFKELKREKKKSTLQKTNENDDVTSIASETAPEEVDKVESTLPNYFTNEIVNNEYQAPATFFDNFSQSHQVVNTTESDLLPETLKHQNGNFTDDFNVLPPVYNVISKDMAPEENFDKQASPTVPSTADSLRQLADEVSQLISNDSASDWHSKTINNNWEELLAQEKFHSDNLRAALLETQAKLSQVESELRHQQLQSVTGQEVGDLKDQMQCHVQTIGILVAEKAELSANFNQSQAVCKQQTVENEELQGRLKTSRSRVADLEREIALMKNEKVLYDKSSNEQNTEVEHLKKYIEGLTEKQEELLQDLQEAREKLKGTSEQNLSMQQQVLELSNQQQMANIKIQQLSMGGSEQINERVEELTKTKFALEKQVSELSYNIKTLVKERDESNIQYQQYAQQLNAQLSNLASKLEQLQKENDALRTQELNRVKHIGELEKQLQNLQNDQINFAVQRGSSSAKAELDGALDVIERVKQENAELQEENIKILSEKELLVKELQGKEEQIVEAQVLMDEWKKNQPDNAKLLAIMESDKVAAARAVSQNTEMKKQMESMDEVFQKLNADKLDLIDRLNTEQHNSKEVFEKLQKTEIHLQTLADAIEIKDKELMHLRETSLELNKQMLNSEQLTDRLRHYEADGNNSHYLQNELQHATATISKLTEEINQLKSPEVDAAKQEIVRLTEEINQLKLNKRDSVDAPPLEPTDQLSSLDKEGAMSSLDKEAAMQRLQDKFLKLMEDIANLTEEKNGLEHLVLQLQGETETIGEYVALYQHQRSLLKQKAVEKDQQLTQLASDRELMKTKLEKLNNLIKKLVVDKGALPAELLDDQHKDLCEEHAKISNEISKINNGYEGDEAKTNETAEEIIALLSEIKHSNLVQPSDEIHHCAWCSGQLITV